MLKEKQIQEASPKEKLYKLFDSAGLHLVVYPSGTKAWRLKFQWNRKEALYTIGQYPMISLAEARRKQFELKEKIKNGIDPCVELKDEKRKQEIAGDQTFEDVAKAWFREWKLEKAEDHSNRVKNRLKEKVCPLIGNMPINQLKLSDFRDVIRIFTARGIFETAKRTFQNLNMILRYAVLHGLIEHNPLASIKPSDIITAHPKKRHHNHITEVELPELLHAIDSYHGNIYTKLALKLLSLTFVRTSEIIQATWSEVNFKKKEWRIAQADKLLELMAIAPNTLQVS